MTDDKDKRIAELELKCALPGNDWDSLSWREALRSQLIIELGKKNAELEAQILEAERRGAIQFLKWFSLWQREVYSKPGAINLEYMTPEEVQKAYDEAPSEPLSDEEIEKIVRKVVEKEVAE